MAKKYNGTQKNAGGFGVSPSRDLSSASCRRQEISNKCASSSVRIKTSSLHVLIHFFLKNDANRIAMENVKKTIKIFIP